MRSAICSTFAPPAEWGLSRHTHPAVVQAIFALSNDERGPEAIWEMPTVNEWQKVADLVAEYVDDGDFVLDSGRLALQHIAAVSQTDDGKKLSAVGLKRVAAIKALRLPHGSQRHLCTLHQNPPLRGAKRYALVI
jgi:hypothetical protein